MIWSLRRKSMSSDDEASDSSIDMGVALSGLDESEFYVR